MSKIIVVFTYKNTWAIDSISTVEIGPRNNRVFTGFPETKFHFASISFNNAVKGNHFNEAGFPRIKGNCILLIHNDEDLNGWDESKEKAIKTFIDTFNDVFIYYHERDKKRHKKIEKIISNNYKVNKDKAMHEDGYLFGRLDEFAVVKNEEEFNTKFNVFLDKYFQDEEVEKKFSSVFENYQKNKDFSTYVKSLNQHFNKEK